MRIPQELIARVADALDELNWRIQALESDSEGGGYEYGEALRKGIQELRTANETLAAQEPAPEAK